MLIKTNYLSTIIWSQCEATTGRIAIKTDGIVPGSSGAGTEMVITIEYTKTTDTATV